jgi:hypothetical protein
MLRKLPVESGQAKDRTRPEADIQAFVLMLQASQAPSVVSGADSLQSMGARSFPDNMMM